MRLSRFQKVLSLLFTDKMTIQRYTTVTNADLSTSTVLSEEPVYSEQPCRISTTRSDNAQTTADDTNPQYSPVKVFCNSSYDIQKGDVITAKRMQDDGTVLITYRGTVNNPLAFPTHQEAEIVDVTYA